MKLPKFGILDKVCVILICLGLVLFGLVVLNALAAGIVYFFNPDLAYQLLGYSLICMWGPPILFSIAGLFAGSPGIGPE